MEFNLLSYILVMLLAGLGSFGGGFGGVNIIRDFAVNWNWLEESEVVGIINLSQFNGYSQGMMAAGFLGGKGGNLVNGEYVSANLGIIGVILGIIAFLLPSLIFIIIILKIGERFYKNDVFKNTLQYINLLAAGMICVMIYQYFIAVFAFDMFFFVIAAAAACFVSIYFNVKTTYIVLGGLVLGVIWGIIPAIQN